jgi:hypothetical protein
VDAKQLVPSSESEETIIVVVAGELLLVEVLHYRRFLRKRMNLGVREGNIAQSFPLEKKWRPTFHHLILFSVITFDLFLLVPAYIVSLPSIQQGAIFNILTTLVTVQGLLLGLLGVSALQFTGDSRILRPLIASTIISVLVSVATIMFGEAAAVSQTVLTTFFLVSVVFFSAVVGVYSWFILDTKASQVAGSATSATPSEHKRVQ